MCRLAAGVKRWWGRVNVPQSTGGGVVKSRVVNKQDKTTGRNSRRLCKTIHDENTGRMKMRIQYLKEYDLDKGPELAKESLLSPLLSTLFPIKAGARQE